VRIDPDAGAAGRIIELDGPGLGQEVAPRVLGVDPELYSVPLGGRSALWDVEALA
jgi:hypothetical protein